MKTTSLGDIKKHLDDLGVGKSVECLIIHSSLFSFGRLDCSVEDLFQCILEQISGNATVFVPGFTLNLTENEVFDCNKTPSQGMGALSEYVRKLPGAVRANNPMHSYVGVGPQADILREVSSSRSFGENSCFQALMKLKPHLLLLGCPFHRGAAHIHQQEAEIGVPYRIWVPLKRSIKAENGSVEGISFQYYGIDRSLSVEWSPLRVLEYLQAHHQVVERPAHYGQSYFLKLSDLDQAAKTVLEQDDNALNIVSPSS